MICGKNLVRHIERVSKDVLRDSKGNRKSDKESWQWNEDLQAIIKAKESHMKKKKQNCKRENSKKKTNQRKWLLRQNIKHTWYFNLDTKEGGKDIYKFVQSRKKRTKDLGNIKITSEF